METGLFVYVFLKIAEHVNSAVHCGGQAPCPQLQPTQCLPVGSLGSDRPRVRVRFPERDSPPASSEVKIIPDPWWNLSFPQNGFV
jgi:hypothetical protein